MTNREPLNQTECLTMELMYMLWLQMQRLFSWQVISSYMCGNLWACIDHQILPDGLYLEALGSQH